MPSSYGSASRVQSVFHASFLFFHFAFGGRTDVDLGHAAGQFRQPLFELFAIVVAGRVFDLTSI